MVQKNLSALTIKKHISNAETFYKSNLSIQDFLYSIKQTKSASTYANHIKTLRILFRDFLKQPEKIEGYNLPKKQYKLKILPTKQELRIFFNELPPKHQFIFLALASSGLRIDELLHSKIIGNMVVPQSHNGSTKHSYVSFINEETLKLKADLSIGKAGVAHMFKKVSIKTGVVIYPHLLRSVFAREMSKAGVPSHYIDAFCGRVPQSILAKSYTDYSSETLKDIYERANISILR